jgi:hypothetical protein
MVANRINGSVTQQDDESEIRRLARRLQRRLLERADRMLDAAPNEAGALVSVANDCGSIVCMMGDESDGWKNGSDTDGEAEAK